MTDQEIAALATEVRDTVSTLNEILARATAAGLKLDVTTREMTAYGIPGVNLVGVQLFLPIKPEG